MANQELFILGAGFSFAVTNGVMPLLNGLTEELLDELYLEDEADLQQLWYRYIETPNIGNVQTPKESNFEDIMTFLSAKFAYEDYKDEHYKAILYQYITERLVAIFEMKNIQKEVKNDNFLLKFAHYLRDTKADIFSFNYDLVLENLLRKIPNSSDVFDPLYTIRRTNSSESRAWLDSKDLFWKNSLKIYKLHGSINWMYDPEYPAGVQVVTSNTLAEYKNGLHYLLVPPTILKNFGIRNNLLDLQWQEFSEKLKYAKKIYIIGYSIPKTDIATYYALKNRVQADCQVFIISPKPKKNEWKQLFKKQHQKKHLHIIQDEFNENSFNQLNLLTNLNNENKN